MLFCYCCVLKSNQITSMFFNIYHYDKITMETGNLKYLLIGCDSTTINFIHVMLDDTLLMMYTKTVHLKLLLFFLSDIDLCCITD
jgi:hypothetical protein